ncbi:AAA family ATPase [Paenibacillus rigui]|nr:AAA family ATPase [Paenibacillus rigui]
MGDKPQKTPAVSGEKKRSRPYSHVWEHYADELARIDLQLQRLYLRRQELTPDPQTDAYRGMFVSEDEFLRLAGGLEPAEPSRNRLEAIRQELEAVETELEQRLAASKMDNVFLPLPYLASVFGLSRVEQRIVMVAAAVELDRKYERIFGFLQDDLTAKLPNISLVLQLVCRTPEEHRSARMAFAPTGKLSRYFFPREESEPAGRSMLSRPVALDRRMAMFLLDSGAFDEGLKPVASMHYPDETLPTLRVHQEVQDRLQAYLRQSAGLKQGYAQEAEPWSAQKQDQVQEQGRMQEKEADRGSKLPQGHDKGKEPLPGLQEQGQRSERWQGDVSTRPGFYLWGKPGAGKKLQAKHACKTLGKPLLLADLSQLMASVSSDADFARRLQELVREALLHQAALGFCRVEVLYPEDADTGAAAKQRAAAFFQIIEQYPGWLFLIGDRSLRLQGASPSRIWLDTELSVPDDRQREALWRDFAAEMRVTSDADWTSMGGKFRFTPGQIRRSLQLAVERSSWNDATNLGEEGGAAGSPRAISRGALIEACYSQVQHKLERKATRIVPRYGWDDVVLPDEQKEQLRSACNQVKYRTLVYGTWGFDRKLAYGKGLSMLFAGPPGTGKTMSAQVVAKELELELYKIDLSQVISKYIGETEKNLHEIFDEAESSQAVLFFDETDALFGKRSEVKDSHDKYANIETAYLLQKMEEYQGISILATNLLQNMDEAFLRRINYIIKYPFPDAVYRESLWRSQFPPEAPLADDVDFKYLGRKYEIAGGNIKNVALTAAFLAASRHERIGMRHILQSVKHELQKSGKIIASKDLDDF